MSRASHCVNRRSRYRSLKITFSLLVALVTVGCSIPRPEQQTILKDTQQTTVDAHQQRLDSIFRWRLSARLAVFQLQTDERDSLYLDWQWQQPMPVQQLRFSHPLKGQLAKLTINTDAATLVTAEQSYRERSAERLIERILGARLPVNALSEWVLGKVTPSLKQRKFITGGRIAEATVSRAAGVSWSIKWYYGDQLLPQQIHLESNQLRIKMQLTEWQTWPRLDTPK